MDKAKCIEFANILEKTASYVSEIEAKLSNSTARVAELEKEAGEVELDQNLSEPLSKLAAAGYSEEELQDLRLVGKSTLEKLAHQAETPVGMGSAHGASAPAEDPLTAFLLS